MKILFAILCVLTTLYPLRAQVVYEPLYKDIYPFLERLSHKGIIQLNDIIKPFSRKYISEKLSDARSKSTALTYLEKEELEFYEKDYYWEMNVINGTPNNKSLSYFERDPAGRYRIFSYNDDTFRFNVNPELGVNVAYIEKDRNIHTLMGLHTYGYLLNNIGFNLYIRSNNEKGNNLNIIEDTNGGSTKYLRPFTPETGIIPEVHDQGRDIGYSEVNASISLDWNWGNINVAKDYMEYGYAKFGNLVLSDRAPSFPHIRLQLKPVDWFNFYYFHAWLNSNVIDSVNLAAYKRDIFMNKYFAWHALVVTPLKGLDISVGESVIYGDKIELLYLMPIMFYFFADEYVSNRQGKPGDANQQIFLSISSKNHLKNTHFYGTLFVDEMTIAGFNGTLLANPNSNPVSSSRNRTQLGFTFGFSIADILFENISLAFEYTRINPFVYGHHDRAQTYQNSSYLMGHWMGHNSDLAYFNLNYKILRGFQMSLWGSYIRKGSDDYSEQYGNIQPEFLFGSKNIYKYFGIDLKYEWLHDLSLEFKFNLDIHTNQIDFNSINRTESNLIFFNINYGI